MAAARVVIFGEVQGVFFRDNCRRQAQTLGVAGWVRNTPDGTVEAHLEGEADAVDRMVTWCKSGPPQACVDRVDVAAQPESGFAGFAVRD